MIIDYHNLYQMVDPLASKYVKYKFLDHLPEHDWIQKLYRGEFIPETPLKVIYASGRILSDVLWGSYVSLFAISQRMLELLQNNRFTGWSTYPLEIYDKRRNLISGYVGFAVKGRTGMRDLKRGEIIIKPPPRPGGESYKVLKGLFFKNDFWDGSDFCTVGFGGSPVITQRVVESLKISKVENIEIIPLIESEINLGTLIIAGQWPP